MSNLDMNKLDIETVNEAVHGLAGMLLDGALSADDNLRAIEAINKLTTMLSRWYHLT
jgi:hypothetical protein